MATPHHTNEIDAHEASGLVERGEAVLIDVREADEHARERIDGAQLVPMSRFDPDAIRCEAGKKVILYCRSGRRSLEAVGALRAHDDEAEAVSMRGGIIGWKKAGKGVVFEPRAPIAIQRQVQLVIGALVLIGTLGGALVSLWLLVLPAFLGAGLIFAGATGTCGLASLLGLMPWNRPSSPAPARQPAPPILRDPAGPVAGDGPPVIEAVSRRSSSTV